MNWKKLMSAQLRLDAAILRQQKERSHAMPSRMYADPANTVEFWRAMEYKKIADELLQEWHTWAAAYRPALGIPGCSPSSRQAQSSKQWQSSYEIGDESVRKKEMENVEWCVDAIPVGCRQAIGIEMRNREARARVWRSPTTVTYDDALEAILPVMKKRGLFD